MGIVSGQRGSPKLVVDGYSFTLNKRRKGKSYWCCAMVRMKRCKARIATDSTSERTKITYDQHTHERDFDVRDESELKRFGSLLIHN